MTGRPGHIFAGEDIFEVAFGLGQTVFFRLRQDRVPGMVTGFVVRPGAVHYFVRWGDDASEGTHTGLELTTDDPGPG